MESRSDSEICEIRAICEICVPRSATALFLPRITQISRISQITLNQLCRNTDREALCKAKNPPDCEKYNHNPEDCVPTGWIHSLPVK